MSFQVAQVLEARFGLPDSYLLLARYEEMDPDSSPYITHYNSFHFLFHSFQTLNPNGSFRFLLYSLQTLNPNGNFRFLLHSFIPS